MPATCHVIPIAQLRTYTNVYLEDDDWDALIEFFRGHPADWATIQALVAELTQAPLFRKPIRVGLSDEEHPEFKRWVWDGTHRACAYILAGATEVEVIFAEEEIEEPYEFEGRSIETKIRRRDGNNFPGETYTEQLWANVMSLRLDDEHWLVSDLNVGHPAGEELTIVWSDDAFDVPVAEIDDAVRARLALRGFNVTALDIRTGVYFYD